MRLTIPLKQAMALLQESSAIILDGSVVTYANPDEEGDPFLEVSWEDEDGNRFEYDFDRCNNEQVQFAGGSLWLIPTNMASENEEPMQITLLEPMNLERIVEDMEAIEKMEATGYDG